MTMTATISDLTEALELYGQHHPECAALWPQKACDCGLSGFVDKPAPRLDMHTAPDELDDVAMHRRPGRPAPRLEERPLVRKCAECSREFEQPRKRGHPLTRCESCRR